MKKSRYFIIAVVAVIGMVFTSCTIDDNAVWHIWRITITGDQVQSHMASIQLGDTIQLGIDVVPEFVTVVDPVWESEDESVATVSQTGLVVALKTGKTTITVHSEYNPDIFDFLYLTVAGGAVGLNEEDAIDQSEAESRRR